MQEACIRCRADRSLIAAAEQTVQESFAPTQVSPQPDGDRARIRVRASGHDRTGAGSTPATVFIDTCSGAGP